MSDQLLQLSNLLLKIKGNKSELQFCKELGVTQYTLNRWINRVHFPNIASLRKIANYMGITLDELYKYLDQEEKVSRNTALSVYPYIKDLPKEELVKLLKLMVDLL